MNPTGRRVLYAHEGMTYDSLRERFLWEIPGRFNLGDACADQQNPRPGAEPSEQLAVELQNHVRTRLAAHETPRQVTFLKELPRTTTGKIMRRALRPTSNQIEIL